MMNAQASPSGSLPFNPTICKWAREWRQRTPEETAKRLNTRPENIHAWESGNGSPTVRQARQLADFYGRSFLEFFLPAPPEIQEPTLVPDFRIRRGLGAPPADRDLKSVQAWAEAMRENALDLYASIGETPRDLDDAIFANLESNPETAAKLARQITGPDVSEQMALAPSDVLTFPKMLRASLEASGILVLRSAQLAKASVSGLCLFATPSGNRVWD